MHYLNERVRRGQDDVSPNSVGVSRRGSSSLLWQERTLIRKVVFVVTRIVTRTRRPLDVLRDNQNKIPLFIFGHVSNTNPRSLYLKSVDYDV